MNRSEKNAESTAFEGTKGYFALTAEGLVKDFEAIKRFIRNYTNARIIYQKMGLDYFFITRERPEESNKK